MRNARFLNAACALPLLPLQPQHLEAPLKDMAVLQSVHVLDTLGTAGLLASLPWGMLCGGPCAQPQLPYLLQFAMLGMCMSLSVSEVPAVLQSVHVLDILSTTGMWAAGFLVKIQAQTLQSVHLCIVSLKCLLCCSRCMQWTF